jgi:hypothetical protein
MARYTARVCAMRSVNDLGTANNTSYRKNTKETDALQVMMSSAASQGEQRYSESTEVTYLRESASPRTGSVA